MHNLPPLKLLFTIILPLFYDNVCHIILILFIKVSALTTKKNNRVFVSFIIGLPKRFCFAKDFWDKGKAGS